MIINFVVNKFVFSKKKLYLCIKNHLINLIMSKKINLVISNKKRPNLSLLFHEYIKRKASEPRGRVITYDDYDEDDYEDMAAYWDKMFLVGMMTLMIVTLCSPCWVILLV